MSGVFSNGNQRKKQTISLTLPKTYLHIRTPDSLTIALVTV